MKEQVAASIEQGGRRRAAAEQAARTCDDVARDGMIACLKFADEAACVASSATCRWCRVHGSSHGSGQCSYAGSSCTYECDGSFFDTAIRANEANHFHDHACPTRDLDGCKFASSSAVDVHSVVTITILALLYFACHAWCCRLTAQRGKTMH